MGFLSMEGDTILGRCERMSLRRWKGTSHKTHYIHESFRECGFEDSTLLSPSTFWPPRDIRWYRYGVCEGPLSGCMKFWMTEMNRFDHQKSWLKWLLKSQSRDRKRSALYCLRLGPLSIFWCRKRYTRNERFPTYTYTSREFRHRKKWLVSVHILCFVIP